MKFLFPEVALYLSKSTIRPCMEYYCHFWAGVPNCHLEFLDKLQKRIQRAVGPSLAPSLEQLAHRRYVTSLSLFYRYYFVRWSSELAQRVPFPYFRGRSTRYSDKLHPSLDATRMSMSTVSFLAQLDSGIRSLRMLTFDLGALSLELIDVFSKQISCISQQQMCFKVFVLLFFCNSMPHSGYSALHGVNPNLKKNLQIRNNSPAR